MQRQKPTQLSIEVRLPLFKNDIKELLKDKSFEDEHTLWVRMLKNVIDLPLYKKDNIDILCGLIHYNQADILQYFITKNKNYFSHLKEYLKRTSPSTINSLFNAKNLYYHLIERNGIETLDVLIQAGLGYEYTHLLAAVEANASISVSYFLKKITLTESQRLELATIARSKGNLSILSQLLPNNPLFYFENILKKMDRKESIHKNELFYHLSQAYRYSSMSKAETLSEFFLTHLEKHYSHPSYEKNTSMLIAEVKKAGTSFPKWASQIAQYTQPFAICDLDKSYNIQSAHIKAEMKMGKMHFNFMKKLYDDKTYRDSELQKLNNDNCPLPIIDKPPKKFISMRDFVRLVSAHHFTEAKERKDNNARKYKTFRNPDNNMMITTGYLCRYDHMFPFAAEMLKKYKDEDKDLKFSYSIFFKDIKMTEFSYCLMSTGQEKFRPQWEHGMGIKNIDIIWPEVENLHKTLLDMDKKEIEENPKRFYELIITGIWLIGNLTPVKRGTGRIVELWLALIHYAHDLPLPVLKKGFQLDCMDLTFDLLTYQRLFFNFFEPRSLTKSALLCKEENNQIPEIANFLKLFDHFKLPEKRKLLTSNNTLFAKKTSVSETITSVKEHLTCRFSPSFQASRLLT